MDSFYEWDPNKAEANVLRHRLQFGGVIGLEWQRAWEWRDTRLPYPEVRTIALVPKQDILFVLVYARRGQRIRVISFRPASRKEFRVYVSNQPPR